MAAAAMVAAAVEKHLEEAEEAERAPEAKAKAADSAKAVVEKWQAVGLAMAAVVNSWSCCRHYCFRQKAVRRPAGA